MFHQKNVSFISFIVYTIRLASGCHDWLQLRMPNCLCWVFPWIWLRLSPSFSIQIYTHIEYTAIFPAMECHKHWPPLHGLKSNILCPHWLLDFNLLSQCTVISGYPCHSLKHISRRNFGRLSCLLRTGVLSWLVGVFFFQLVFFCLPFVIGHSVCECIILDNLNM